MSEESMEERFRWAVMYCLIRNHAGTAAPTLLKQVNKVRHCGNLRVRDLVVFLLRFKGSIDPRQQIIAEIADQLTRQLNMAGASSDLALQAWQQAAEVKYGVRNPFKADLAYLQEKQQQRAQPTMLQAA